MVLPELRVTYIPGQYCGFILCVAAVSCRPDGRRRETVGGDEEAEVGSSRGSRLLVSDGLLDARCDDRCCCI